VDDVRNGVSQTRDSVAVLRVLEKFEPSYTSHVTWCDQVAYRAAEQLCYVIQRSQLNICASGCYFAHVWVAGIPKTILAKRHSRLIIIVHFHDRVSSGHGVGRPKRAGDKRREMKNSWSLFRSSCPAVAMASIPV
jgi:hypothetical protein